MDYVLINLAIIWIISMFLKFNSPKNAKIWPELTRITIMTEECRMCGGVGLNAMFTLLMRSRNGNIKQVTWLTKRNHHLFFVRDPELRWAKLWKAPADKCPLFGQTSTCCCAAAALTLRFGVFLRDSGGPWSCKYTNLLTEYAACYWYKLKKKPHSTLDTINIENVNEFIGL